MPEGLSCRLCFSRDNLREVTGADKRKYFLCGLCSLINVYPEYFLNPEDEKKRYLTHNNGPEHTGHVEFLKRATGPALKYLNKDMHGLDYGCGYAPSLSVILKEHGYKCDDYDPIFKDRPLNKKYDFIFSTEVFEHFFYPAKDIKKICDLLNPEGILVVMTELWKNLEQFKVWHYTKDSAHTAFYCMETFDYLCTGFHLEKLYDDGNRVVIMKKRS
jgi:SAM-dependent methyltransferase